MINIYKQLLNLQSATFVHIDHEDAMVASVYKIIQSNQKPLILKICDHSRNYLREVYLLNRLAKTLPVPKIIQTIEPQENISGAILMEYVPGELFTTADCTEPLAYEIGKCLASIHLNRLQGYGDPLCSDLTTDPRAYFTLKFREGIAECHQNLPAELLSWCQSFYDAHVDLLLSVDGPCVVHRDFRPGNLIVQNGKLQAIIDWAGARASFAEEDFCSMEHGEWLQGPHIKKSLLAGYAAIRPVPDYQRLLPLLRINKAIATIGFTVKREIWNTSGFRVYNCNRQFLEYSFEHLT